jgi:protein-tyrosine phosphatase
MQIQTNNSIHNTSMSTIMFNPNQTSTSSPSSFFKIQSPTYSNPQVSKFNFENDLTDSAISTLDSIMTDSESATINISSNFITDLISTENLKNNLNNQNNSLIYKNDQNNDQNSINNQNNTQNNSNNQISQTPTSTTDFKLPLCIPSKKSKKLSRKNRPANLSIPTKISTFTENSLESITPPPVITSKTRNSTASKITDKLILGSESDACDVEIYKKFNITKVLTIMSDNFELPECVKKVIGSDENIKFIKLNDTSCSDIGCYFREAIEFMEGNGTCLVHCRAGISRSSTLIMAYLIEKNSWSLNEAFTFTKSKRSCVAPNFGFLGQLQQFEDDLNSKKMVKL